MTANQGADDVNTKQERETMQGKPDLTVCQPGDVGVTREGVQIPYKGATPRDWDTWDSHPYFSGGQSYTQDGRVHVLDIEAPDDIIAILRDGRQISPPVSKPVEPVNAGAGADLGRYRTGETPMVGDVVRFLRGLPGDWAECSADHSGVVIEIPGNRDRCVRTNCGEHFAPYACRFDLISRPAPSPGQGAEGEDKDARIANLELAAAVEHHARNMKAIDLALGEPRYPDGCLLDCFLRAIAELKAPASPAESPEPVEILPDCQCITCWDVRHPDEMCRPFITCPTCGNKRCPKATHHSHACTGSNASGQPGSIFGPPAVSPAAPVPAGQVVDGPGRLEELEAENEALNIVLDRNRKRATFWQEQCELREKRLREVESHLDELRAVVAAHAMLEAHGKANT